MSIIPFKAARLAVALALGAGIAAASPTFTVLYDAGANISAADKTIIQNAVNFYTSNMTGSWSVSIVFGSQVAGGATSEKLVYGGLSYNSYYNDLGSNSSGDATDLAAIASLGGGPHTSNPVNGTTSIAMTTTLASALGLAAQQGTTWADCGGVSADACITLSTALLNASGSPDVELNADVQHEIDEVLGTSSALPNGGGTLATNPDVADLFRYSAPGTRSYALNTSTSNPCTGAAAYFSVDGGTTNLDSYNNCNNGGEYGDWFCDDGSQVQCYAGPGGVPASLTLSSSEVKLLDAVGFNFASAAVPEPSSVVLLMAGLGALAVPWRRRRNKK